MKRFQGFFFYLYMGAMLCILAWSVFTHAQPTNTATVTAQANAPVQAVNVVVKNESPSLSFGLDRFEELQRPIFGIPVWQYIASAFYVLLAVLVARIVNYLVTVQLKKLFVRTKWTFGERIVQLLNGPIRMLVLVLLLQLGLNLYQWPPWMEAWLRKALYVLLACSVTWMVLKLVDLGATYWRERQAAKADKHFNDQLVPLISKSLKVFLFIMAILVTLDNIGFNIRTLLAGVSISGLALGLAAQDTVGNLFGAAAVFMDKPFKIGDVIKMSEGEGVVEEMGLRSTRIRNPDGHLITIPNKTMGNSTITNITRRPNIKTTLNIGVTYDTTADQIAQATKILEEIYRAHPMTHDLIIGFNQFGDSALNLQVIHWWKGLNYKEYVAGLQELNLTVKRRFDEARINFAFPSRTVYLRQENDWRVQLPGNDQPRLSA
ncbi:MAG TPA: mechanosensitive ion channel family protein [Verrucomicrobiae bacterium]